MTKACVRTVPLAIFPCMTLCFSLSSFLVLITKKTKLKRTLKYEVGKERMGLIGLGVMVMYVKGCICGFVLVCVCGMDRVRLEANYTVLYFLKS